MKSYFSILVIVILTCLLFNSCRFGLGASNTWMNGDIDPDVKGKLSVLNNKLYSAIKANNVADVKSLMSSGLLENLGSKVDTIVNNVSPGIQGTDYTIKDEFYTKNSSTNITNLLLSSHGDNHDYQIKYLALNKEMYVSVLTSKDDISNTMLLAIYGRYGNEWKLNILQIGEYSVLNKTAPDLYADALIQNNKGYLINAADLMIMASHLASPGGQCFTYKNNDAMKSFYNTLLTQANSVYHFPLTVNQVKTKPEIFTVKPEMIAGGDHKGIFPIVGYRSTIALTDTIALNVENLALHKVIGIIFKGIDQDTVIYQAFNQIPDGKSLVKRFGFVRKAKS